MLLEEGEYGRALEEHERQRVLSREIGYREGESDALVLLGVSLAGLGRIDEAVTCLEVAVRLDPGDRESRSLLGLLRAATPPDGDASGLGRLLGDDTFATVAFGTLCLEQGCVEEAAQAFTRILRRDPEHREARERLETTLRARQRRKG